MLTVKERVEALEERLEAMQEACLTLLDRTVRIEAAVDRLTQLQLGDWEIKEKQMIFYDTQGIEIARFDLFDRYGNPSDTNVFKRRRV